MRSLIILLTCVLYCASTKNNPKTLTESMGQEVIELASPLKDLHPDIEEEPSAEADETDKSTSTTLQPGTARDSKKAIETRRKMKDIDKMYGVRQEDEEAKIERELAEMYKDTDYKADSAEVSSESSTTENPTNVTQKPVGRMRNNFKFQPDVNNRKEVENFRTSIDEISCDNKKLVGVTDRPNSGFKTTLSRIVIWTALVITPKFI